jgi:hypothetical protein
MTAARAAEAGPAVHFLHIGKTGGTATKTALIPHRSSGPYVLALGGGHRLGLRDVPPGDRFFFAVRDPVDRFVSGFYSRKLHDRPGYVAAKGVSEPRPPLTDEEVAGFARFPTPNALASALGSMDAEERTAAEAAIASIGQVRAGYWRWLGDPELLAARAPDAVMVLRQPRLAEDFAVLCRLLGLPGVRLPDDDVRAKRNPPDVDRTLDPAAAANLRRWLAPDYEAVRQCASIWGGGDPQWLPCPYDTVT